MAIYKKKHTTNYTTIGNGCLQNKQISFKARGILSYLLSLPESWEVKLLHIQEQAPDGKVSVRTGVQELMDAGHIVMRQIRDQKKRINRVVYDVYESPRKQNLLVENSSKNDTKATSRKHDPLVSTYKGVSTKEKKHSPSGRRAKAHSPVKADSFSFDDTYGVLVKEGVERSGSISRRTTTSSWVKQVRLVRENGIPKKRIKQVVMWFVRHSQDKYTPKLYKIEHFRQKFEQLEDAMNREVSDNPEDHVKVSGAALTISYELLEDFEVPVKGREALPQTVQISLDKYSVVLEHHHKLLSDIDELDLDSDVRDTMEYMDEHFFRKPVEFVEHYFHVMLANKWFWFYDITKVAFSFNGENFNRLAEDFMYDYSHDHKAWKQYKHLLGKELNEGK